MRAEIIGQRLGVVIPDRLVQLGRGQDYVIACPDRRAKGKPVADPGCGQRLRDDPVLRTVENPVGPVHDVVDQACAAGRKLNAKEALHETLAHLCWRGRLLPTGYTRRGLPLFSAAVAPVAAVPSEQERVHRHRSYRTGHQSASDGTQGGHGQGRGSARNALTSAATSTGYWNRKPCAASG